MDVAHDISFYKVLLIVLAATAIVIPLVKQLRLPPVLGYMLVGMAVGPFGIGKLVVDMPILSAITIESRASIVPVAELGVAMLMFMIGLELSLERIWVMRRLVFGLGLLQLTVCGIVLAGLAALGDPDTRAAPQAAVAIGVGLAMSSTAVVLQVLADRRQLTTPAGRASFAVLLFQDLAVVPVLFGLTTFSPHGLSAGQGGLWLAMGKAVAVVALIVLAGRLILRPWFRHIARTRESEFFVAACLLVVISCSIAAVWAGMSMALGALIGGLLLAGTEYRRQVEATIAPFKGLLVGIFLISIGMTLDWHVLVAEFPVAVTATIGLVVVKAALIAALARPFGLTWAQGIQAGLLLGPGGEFGFVVVAAALHGQLIDTRDASLLLLVLALTMAAIPSLASLGAWLTGRQRAPRFIDPALRPPEATDETPRVIIAGYGRVGRLITSLLDHHNVPYIAIDRDPDLVARDRASNRQLFYGDLTHPALLHHLQVSSALAFVVTVDDPEMALALVRAAHAERRDLRIIARARDGRHAAALYGAGATDAVPETIEASLQLAEAVLIDIGTAMGPIIVSIHEKRAELQEGIRALAPTASTRVLGGRRLGGTT